MSAVLPADLFEAEERTLVALRRLWAQSDAVVADHRNLRPASARSFLAIGNGAEGKRPQLLLAWPDAGAALAKRDGPELADFCMDLLRSTRSSLAQRGAPADRWSQPAITTLLKRSATSGWNLLCCSTDGWKMPRSGSAAWPTPGDEDLSPPGNRPLSWPFVRGTHAGALERMELS